MKTGARWLSLILLVMSAFLVFDGSANGEKNKRGEDLFLAGATKISQGRYVEARMLLDTLIYTYPDSPLSDPAKVLEFYSYGREGGPKNETESRLLKQIEEQIKNYDLRWQKIR